MNYALMTQTQNLLSPTYTISDGMVLNLERKASVYRLDERGVPVDPSYDRQFSIREHFVDHNRWPEGRKGYTNNGIAVRNNVPIFVFRASKLYRKPDLLSAKEEFGDMVRNRLTGTVKNSTMTWAMYEDDFESAIVMDNGTVIPKQYRER